MILFLITSSWSTGYLRWPTVPPFSLCCGLCCGWSAHPGCPRHPWLTIRRSAGQNSLTAFLWNDPQKTAVAESVLITASRFDFCVHSAIVTLDLTGLSWSELTCKLTYLLFKRQRMKQKSWVNFRGMTSWCYSWVLEQKREMIIKHVLLSVCSSRNQASNIVLQPASEIWNYISAVLINKML